MPFLAFVHSHDPEPLPERDEGPRPWEPNWRVWRWVGAALLVGYASAHAGGAIGAGLVMVAFVLGCKAFAEALPYGSGLREWRQ
jgi:hypothetical protein